jgi:hypothetical protein
MGGSRSHIYELLLRIEDSAVNGSRIVFVLAERELSFVQVSHGTAWNRCDGGYQHKKVKKLHDV